MINIDEQKNLSRAKRMWASKQWGGKLLFADFDVSKIHNNSFGLDGKLPALFLLNGAGKKLFQKIGAINSLTSLEFWLAENFGN